MQCPAIRATTAGHRLHHIGALARIADALGHFAYLIETPVFGLIVAARDSVALALLGIPLTVTWGLSAFITNYIPNVGIIIGVVPPALLGLLTGGPHLMVIVIVVYCALNFVVQSIIQPRFIGDAVGLSVTVTFVALVFWAWLLGPLGAILAIPLTLLAKGHARGCGPPGPMSPVRGCEPRPRNRTRPRPRSGSRARTGPAARNPAPEPTS